MSINISPCPSCNCPEEGVKTVYLHQPSPSLSQPAECVYSREIHGIWNVEAFFLCASDTPDTQDVTILIQMTLERFNTLIEVAHRWSGPLSIVLYVPQNDYFVTEIKRLYNKHEVLQKYADIHILYEEESRYPINHLRNLAMKYARTQYVLTLDVDFIPNPDMREQLREATSRLKESSTREALVIPAFEVPSGDYPNTKKDLKMLHKVNKAYQVHLYKGKHAHLPTNYNKWMETDEPYEVDYEYSYEPYFVIKRQDCPLYDERFIGYGNDKSSHAYELAAAGFHFLVIPEPFIIHKDHPTPPWRSDQGSLESWARWSDFVKDMNWKYGFLLPVPKWLQDACISGDCPQFWLWN